MNVNRRLSEDARQHLDECLALHDSLTCPYDSVMHLYSMSRRYADTASECNHSHTAKRINMTHAAHYLHLAILRRRKNACGFRWVDGYPK